MRKLSLLVFLASCALPILWAISCYPDLPERVPIHFGLAGEPDRWSSKSLFLGLLVGVFALDAVLFLGMAYGLPKLAEGQRATALRRVSPHLLWFGVATNAVLADLFLQAGRVALGEAEGLQHFWWTLSLYVAFSVPWMILLVRRVPADSPVAQRAR